MADYNLITTNTPLQPTRVPEIPGLGPVRGPVQYVGATELQGGWPNSVLMNDNISHEGNTLSLRTRVSERDSVNPLTRTEHLRRHSTSLCTEFR